MKPLIVLLPETRDFFIELVYVELSSNGRQSVVVEIVRIIVREICTPRHTSSDYSRVWIFTAFYSSQIHFMPYAVKNRLNIESIWAYI